MSEEPAQLLQKELLETEHILHEVNSHQSQFSVEEAVQSQQNQLTQQSEEDSQNAEEMTQQDLEAELTSTGGNMEETISKLNHQTRRENDQIRQTHQHLTQRHEELSPQEVDLNNGEGLESENNEDHHDLDSQHVEMRHVSQSSLEDDNNEPKGHWTDHQDESMTSHHNMDHNDLNDDSQGDPDLQQAYLSNPMLLQTAIPISATLGSPSDLHALSSQMIPQMHMQNVAGKMSQQLQFFPFSHSFSSPSGGGNKGPVSPNQQTLLTPFGAYAQQHLVPMPQNGHQVVLGTPIQMNQQESNQGPVTMTPIGVYATKDISTIANAWHKAKEVTLTLDEVRNGISHLVKDIETKGTVDSMEELISFLKKVEANLAIHQDVSRAGDQKEWLQQMGLDQLVPRPGGRIPVTKLRNPTQRIRCIRKIMEPIEHAIQVHEKKTMLDLIREIPEYGRRILDDPKAHVPSQIQLIVQHPDALDPQVLHELSQVGELTAPIIPNSSEFQHISKKRSSETDLNDPSSFKKIKLDHQLANLINPNTMSLPEVLSGSPSMVVPADTLRYRDLDQELLIRVDAMSSSQEENSPTSPHTPSSSKKRAPKTPRQRFPDNTKEEWGFDADDIRNELLAENAIDPSKPGKADRRGYKWARIAKKIGNAQFLSQGDCGPKLKAILRRKYPELVGQKVKVPIDTKTEWGFTADDIKAKIEELSQFEGIPPGTPHKNISLSKIGALLGHSVSRDSKHKPFAERKDRGQLVHALLRMKFPELASKFQRPKKWKS